MALNKVQCYHCGKWKSPSINADDPAKSEITLLERFPAGVRYTCAPCHDQLEQATIEKQKGNRHVYKQPSQEAEAYVWSPGSGTSVGASPGLSRSSSDTSHRA